MGHSAESIPIRLIPFRIKGKTVVVDGSKVKANANREMLTIEKTEQRLSNLDNNLKKYLDKLAEKDVQEDIFDEDDNSNNKTDSINKHLMEKIIILKSKIEKLEKTKQKIEESGKKYFSTTDPDANPNIPVDSINPNVFSGHYELIQLPVYLNSGEYIRLELGIDNNASGTSYVLFDNIELSDPNTEAFHSLRHCPHHR